MRRSASVVFTALLVVSTAICASFTAVDYPGSTVTNLRAINPQGDIVGNYMLPGDSRFHGFLLSRGEYSKIEYPGSVVTFLVGINAEGAIVGKYMAPDGSTHAFLLRNGVFTVLIFQGCGSC
jgi:probable HAF family extracellular repeat protein